MIGTAKPLGEEALLQLERINGKAPAVTHGAFAFVRGTRRLGNNAEANLGSAAFALSQPGEFQFFVGPCRDRYGVLGDGTINGLHQHFVLCIQPIGIGVSVGPTIGDPKLIGAFANRFFRMFHETAPVRPRALRKMPWQWLTKS
jgi:hypothetical protein